MTFSEIFIPTLIHTNINN